MSVKGKIAKLAVIVTMMAVSLFSSCKNGMQDMVDVLDNKLVVQKTPDPGEGRFDPENMLSEKYFVENDSTLCLAAPSAASYHWQLYKMIKEEEVYEELDFKYTFVTTYYEDLQIERYVSAYEKSFVLYIPDLGKILTDSTYRIVLTVKDKDGNEYIDSAGLVIYEPCYDLDDVNLPT